MQFIIFCGDGTCLALIEKRRANWEVKNVCLVLKWKVYPWWDICIISNIPTKSAWLKLLFIGYLPNWIYPILANSNLHPLIFLHESSKMTCVVIQEEDSIEICGARTPRNLRGSSVSPFLYGPQRKIGTDWMIIWELIWVKLLKLSFSCVLMEAKSGLSSILIGDDVWR